jgi:NTE family protein
MNIHQTVGSSSEKATVKKSKTKFLNLALQGGGAHGAFTWGVLDRLLEEPRLDFEGVVATSAGFRSAGGTRY